MALCLNKLTVPAQGCLLRKGARVFGLLGKATPSGVASFTSRDIAGSWALTAEYGCLRLERLSGDEEVARAQIFLPVPSSYDYGLTGIDGSPDLVRTIFGLLPAELEQLVGVLRRGSFPILGFSLNDLRCSISSSIIPGYWPHVVTSNMAIHGNVISLESFMRILVNSMSQSRLGTRYPALQPLFRRIMQSMAMHRRGIPFTRETLALAPTPSWLR
jgi:hypothetical protein